MTTPRKAAGTRRADNPIPKSHKTALVVIPPKECWPPVQALRERYDARLLRWMPHLSLLYPFAPPDQWERLFPRLIRVCSGLAPFTVRLSRFGHFKHDGGGFSIWVAPEDPLPLAHLHRELLWAAPGYRDTASFAGGFQPHLSLGQVARRASLAKLMEQFQQDWQPLEFEVRQVLLLRRGDPPEDSFGVVRGFALGADAEGDGA